MQSRGLSPEVRRAGPCAVPLLPGELPVGRRHYTHSTPRGPEPELAAPSASCAETRPDLSLLGTARPLMPSYSGSRGEAWGRELTAAKPLSRKRIIGDPGAVVLRTLCRDSSPPCLCVKLDQAHQTDDLK